MRFIFVNLGETGNFKTKEERFGKRRPYLSKINPCRWEVSSYDDKERRNLKEDGMDYYIFSSTVDDEDDFYDYDSFDLMLDEGIDYPFFDEFDDDFDDSEGT